MISFIVYGQAKPAGALQIGRTGDGRSFLHHRSSKSLAEWKAAIKREAAEATHGSPYTGAVALDARFYVQRPAGHYGKRGLRPSAPAYPIKRSVGDIDKLARALLDALTGVSFLDDSQVVDLKLSKRYADDGPVHIAVQIRQLGDGLDVLLAEAL